MFWKDLLYFSKGERSALTFLVILIGIALVLLIFTDKQESNVATATDSQTDSIIINAVQTYKEAIKENRGNRYNKASHPNYYGKNFSTNSSASNSKYISNKYPEGTVVELNRADSAELKKVPGIGDVYARRIVKFRDLLGGFYSVEQLREVYGLDEEKFSSLAPWFKVDTSMIQKLSVNTLPEESLRKHPYLSYKQAKVLSQLRKRLGKLTGWKELDLLEEFTETDKRRLAFYLAF